jgi:hypothetical protein
MNGQPPTVYVREPLRWEYKQLVCRLEEEGAPTSEQLDALGVDGWELTGILSNPPMAYLYSKRTAERKRR